MKLEDIKDSWDILKDCEPIGPINHREAELKAAAAKEVELALKHASDLWTSLRQVVRSIGTMAPGALPDKKLKTEELWKKGQQIAHLEELLQSLLDNDLKGCQRPLPLQSSGRGLHPKNTPMKIMTQQFSIWKIENKETGQFSTGGTTPKWTTNGKIYTSRRFAESALKLAMDRSRHVTVTDDHRKAIRAYIKVAQIVCFQMVRDNAVLSVESSQEPIERIADSLESIAESLKKEKRSKKKGKS